MAKRVIAVLEASGSILGRRTYRKDGGYTTSIKLAQKFSFPEHLYSHGMPRWTAIGYEIPLEDYDDL